MTLVMLGLDLQVNCAFATQSTVVFGYSRLWFWSFWFFWSCQLFPVVLSPAKNFVCELVSSCLRLADQ